MAFQLSSIYRSLLRRVVETIDDVRDQGISSTLTYYAWDSRNDQAELEAMDLLGLAGWTFRENKGLWMIHAGLTLSTLNDENLVREVAIMDVIHNRWGENASIPLYDIDEGTVYTNLVVSEFEVMPAGTSEKRNFRPIGLELKRTAND